MSAHREDGFSLLEMLVALALIASIAAITLALFQRSPDRVQIAAVSKIVLSALKSARATAIARNSETALMFDLERRTLRSSVIPTYTLPRNVELDLRIADAAREQPSRGSIKFFSDGSSTGGDLILTLGSFSSTICVNWLTGIAVEDQSCRK